MEMKNLEIREYPDKILLCKSQEIEKITEEERVLFNNMLFTMRSLQGIGLAAPQVGISKKLFVADIGEGPLVLANPEIIKVKGKDRMEEGCLSAPGVLVNVERAQEVIIQGLDEQGKIVEVQAKGLLARVILHEIDHLNGKLIINYMNFLKRLKFKLCSKKSPKN